jgi:hypothetical protein
METENYGLLSIGSHKGTYVGKYSNTRYTNTVKDPCNVFRVSGVCLSHNKGNHRLISLNVIQTYVRKDCYDVISFMAVLFHENT